MTELIKNFIEFLNTMMQNSGDLGYLWLMFGTFAESFFPPIPSEALMGLAGYLISTGTWSWAQVIIFAVLGNLISTAIVWKLGHSYGEKFILKWGKYIGYESADLDTAKKLFDRWGYGIIFICQMVPVMRSVISLPAGVLKTKLIPTLISTGLGAGIWLSIWTYIGVQLGSRYKEILDNSFIKAVEKPLMFIIVLTFAIYIYKIWSKRHKKVI
jgi:membrane protein DedA with SNARE-associated domain